MRLVGCSSDPRQGIAGSVEVVPLSLFLANAVPVLARVDLLPLAEIEKGVESRCKESAEHGADPVYPVVGREAAVDDGWTQGTSRVERGSSEVYT